MAAPSYTVTGYITAVAQTARGEPSRFSIRASNGADYRVVNKFAFCNLMEGDTITGVATMEGDTLVLTTQPFVQLPTDEQNLKQCFIRALRGSGFGDLSAQGLYDKLAKLAEHAGMVKAQLAARKKVQAAAMVEVPTIPGIPGVGPTISIAAPTPADLQEQDCAKLNGGVTGYLSTAAAEYVKTFNKSIVELLVAGTELKPEQADKLLRWWHSSRSKRRLFLLGLTNKEIEAANLPLDALYEQLLTNPLVVPCIEMEKALSIATSLRFTPTSSQVTCGQIVRKVYECLESMAWTCTPLWLLTKQFPSFHTLRAMLTTEYKCFLEYDCLYLPYPYQVETYLARFFDERIKRTAKEMRTLAERDVPAMETANYLCKTLTDDQKLSIQGALTSPLSIINGGAGTGKSTVINELVHNLQLREIPFAAAAFTGKAVARLQEVFNCKLAMTMDRMIARVSIIPEFKFLLIDEFSMVSADLMYRFLQAFGHPFWICLVGDSNQLLPIQFGTVMCQLLFSKRVPTYTLTFNHRIVQHVVEPGAEGVSLEGKSPGEVNFDRVILENANALVNPSRDLSYPLSFRSGLGFYEMEGGIALVHTILAQLKAAEIPFSDVVVICPYNDQMDVLNGIFQAVYLEQAKKHRDKFGKLWCVGERVMATTNLYDIGIMNGEEGEETQLSDEGVTVRFKDGAEHLFKWATRDWKKDYTKKGEALEQEYDGSTELTTDLITASGAISAHKSQGSEYKYVISYIPLRQNRNGNVGKFLNINLLYVIMTRPKQAYWSVGSMHTIAQATMQRPAARYENLCRRLNLSRDVELEQPIADLHSKVAAIGAPAEGGDDGMPSHEDLWQYED